MYNIVTMVKSKPETERLSDITEVMLDVIIVAGVITMAMLAPNCLQLLKIKDRKRRSKTIYYLKQKLIILERSGLIKSKHDGGEIYFELTRAGEQWLEKEKIKRRRNEQKGKWSGSWWLVMFDIKEFSRRKRDLLRNELRGFGFVKLQNSVWVTPYECGDVVELLKTELLLGNDVVYLKTVAISNDYQLRKLFNLPLSR